MTTWLMSFAKSQRGEKYTIDVLKFDGMSAQNCRIRGLEFSFKQNEIKTSTTKNITYSFYKYAQNKGNVNSYGPKVAQPKSTNQSLNSNSLPKQYI